MYAVRTEFIVAPGASSEVEDFVTKLGKLRTGKPGFLGQTLLRSYAYLGKYTTVARFESAEAAFTLGNSAEFSAFMKTATPGSFTLSRPQEGYDGVLDVNADNISATGIESHCEMLVDWVVTPGKAAALEASRREIFELRKKHQAGFVSNRLRRNAGARNRYLIIQILTNREAAIAAPAPEVAAWGPTHPASAYATTPQSQEIYHVVHRM